MGTRRICHGNGTIGFFIQFLKTGYRFEPWVKDCLLIYKRNVRLNNPDTHRFLGEGKRKATLDEFLSSLTAEQRASIECVGIDRGGSYQASVKEYLHDAGIV